VDMVAGEPYEAKCVCAAPTGVSLVPEPHRAAARRAGKDRQVVRNATDIEDRKQAENALRESEKSSVSSPRTSGGLLDDHSPFDEVLYVSPLTRAFGDDLWKAYVNDRNHSWTRYTARIASAWSASLRSSGNRIRVEYRIVRPDGSVRWIRDRGFP